MTNDLGYFDESSQNPCIFDSGEKGTNTIYSDRLLMWDHDKHDKLCQKHFGNSGQIWSKRDPDKIEEFLRDYTGDKKLYLCRIEEHKNLSNGFTLWRFDVKLENE